jgi:cell division protein FtsI/penicillin-binding protein 2
MSGLALLPVQRRVYPAGDIGGHALGFVNLEGEGFFGVEGYYDEWLAGKPITVEKSFIPFEARLQPDSPAGVNLVLTIDLDIQQVAENTLEKAVTNTGSESGQVLIMDPSNGEILAMAAWPRLDPNRYDLWLDNGELPAEVISPAVAGTFEPGSTFKALVMAAALDNGSISIDDEFVDTGEIEVGGHIIRNWDGEAWGPQTMTGCMQHSLNVCLAYIASQKLGAGPLYSYLESFGIGELSSIDLAGEVKGQLRTPRHPVWTEADLGTNSFGQGMAVTPVQLVTAIASIANQGMMMQPHIVRQVVSSDGAYWPNPTVIGRPISEETAALVNQMLTEALRGESSASLVDGYTLAGKTGTASIPTEFGYDPNKTIASFVGWGPVEDPRFVILVRLDKPGISPWGSVVAAPVFHDLVERLVVFLEIPPTTAVDEIAAIWIED